MAYEGRGKIFQNRYSLKQRDKTIVNSSINTSTNKEIISELKDFNADISNNMFGGIVI